MGADLRPISATNLKFSQKEYDNTTAHDMRESVSTTKVFRNIVYLENIKFLFNAPFV